MQKTFKALYLFCGIDAIPEEWQEVTPDIGKTIKYKCLGGKYGFVNRRERNGL